MSVADILFKSHELVAGGADVIDLGCLPDTPFDHLEQTIAALKAAGLKVSVDSADVAELERAAKAGVDHLLEPRSKKRFRSCPTNRPSFRS